MTETEKTTAKRSRGWRIPLIVGAVLTVAVLAGLGIWWAMSSGASADREKAIEATVLEYYAAITEADATRALGLATSPVEAGPLLHDDALKASNAVAPLSKVAVNSVTASEPYERAVANVSYQLGKESITLDVPLSHTPQGWRLDHVVSDLTLSHTNGLLVNGQAVPTTNLKVLPGTYTATPISDVVELEGETTVTVLKAGDTGAAIPATPKLSAVGVDKTKKAAVAALNACLASKVSAPPNCPWAMNDAGVEVAKDSVKYTLGNDPWANFTPTLEAEALSATGSTNLVVDATATVTYQGVTGTVSRKIETPLVLHVDLTAEPPTVVWSK